MAEQKFDFKKEFKNIYLQKTQPVIVEVPPMTYLCVDGKGNPNTTQEYKDALAILYGLSYTIKMSKMDGTQPVGYFDYVVPPLEGLWWMENGEGFDGIHITVSYTHLMARMTALAVSVIRPSFRFIAVTVFSVASSEAGEISRTMVCSLQGIPNSLT